MTNLYLIDDHQFIVDGIVRIIETCADIHVIGHSTNPQEAIGHLTQTNIIPDVVICDLSMPGLSGAEVLCEVRKTHPSLRFLILTMHDDPENVIAIADAGAEGYVLKSSSAEIFIDAIRRVAAGGTYYSSEVIQYLFQASKQRAETVDELKPFTDREIEILKLVLQEKTSQEIGEALFISKQTVDTHRKHILQKSGETTLIGLVKFGFRNGLTTA